jgi:hypothetical protein
MAARTSDDSTSSDAHCIEVGHQSDAHELQVEWPSRRWVEFGSREFGLVGGFEASPVVGEVFIGDVEGRFRICRTSTVTPPSLFAFVNLEIHEFARRPRLGGKSSKCGSLSPAPDPEVQDDVDVTAQGVKRQPDQTTFEDVALPVGVVVMKQRDHPLVGRQPESSTFFLNRLGPRGLPGCGEPRPMTNSVEVVRLTCPIMFQAIRNGLA